MGVQWLGWLVLSVLVICTHTAPVTEVTDSPVPGCSHDEFLQTGGLCDIGEHGEIQEICREIRKAQGESYNRDESGNEASDGVSCFADLLLDKSQAEGLLQSIQESQGGSGQRRRVKRKLRSDFQTNKWPTNIYYMVDNSLGDGGAAAVREGVSMWEEVTCLRFNEISDQDFTTQHLVFVNGGSILSGCRSYIGRVPSLLAQPIYLSYHCSYKAVVAHEIAHALGFIHEHQRPDRDSYVTVHTANIRRGYEGYFASFKPTVVTSLGVQYDYASVMHYYGTAFSNRDYTIETKDPRYQKTIGQRVEISYLDAKLINQAYCADTCNNHTQLSCQNQGYQDPHDCSTCRCPDGWEGVLCERLAAGKKAECGGTLVATSEAQYIQSPGYDSSSKIYTVGQECTWLIRTSQGGHVKLEFEGDFRLQDEGDTCYHWLEVRADMDSDQLAIKGPRYCGNTRPSDVITSTGNEVMVLFRARFMIRARVEMRGFRLKYLSDENACSNEPCQNDGICHSNGIGFTCECRHGFHGDTCREYNYDVYKDIDLVLMVDQTYHSYKDFYYFKTLAQHLLSYISNPSISISSGLMGFYSTPHVLTELNSNTDFSVLINAIDSLYTHFSGTDIFSAFKSLFSEYYNTSSGGDRLSVSNVAVMIVDSRHTYWSSQGMIEDVQTQLREGCIEVVVVDIGSRVDRGLLETLVGRTNVLHQPNYRALLEPGTIDSVISKVKTAVMASEHCLRSKTTSKISSVEPTSSVDVTTSSTTTSITITSPPSSTTTPTTSTTSVRDTTTKLSTTVFKPVDTSPTKTSTATSTMLPSSSSTGTTRTSTTAQTTETLTSTTTTATTTTKSTTTSTATSITTTGDRPRSGCSTQKGPCDQECGGCGYMDVVQFCHVNGEEQIMDEYREPCNTKPCERDCSIWIGRFYRRTCKICCPGYIVQGEVCIQDD